MNREKKMFGMLLTMAGLAAFFTCFTGTWAAAQEDTVAEDQRVAGCQAVQVDPDASYEFQQAICSAAEAEPGSSCAAAGHGLCSSPKTNDMMPSATNCICIGENEEAAAVTEESSGEGEETVPVADEPAPDAGQTPPAE